MLDPSHFCFEIYGWGNCNSKLNNFWEMRGVGGDLFNLSPLSPLHKRGKSVRVGVRPHPRHLPKERVRLLLELSKIIKKTYV